MGWLKKIFDPSPIATDAEKADLTKSIARIDVAVEVLTEKVHTIQTDREENQQQFEKLLDDALSVIKSRPARAAS